jgi:uncharacterized protein (TIGR02118 family)
MIRIIAFYRWREGASFNHDYYNSEYMRLTKELLSPHGLLGLESDHYVTNGELKEGEIMAATNAYFTSLEAAKSALAAVRGALLANVPKYTNLKPEIRFSQVTRH